MPPGSRKDASIADRRECEERVESQEARAGLEAQGLREGPAEIKRAACHTSTAVLIRGSLLSLRRFFNQSNRPNWFCNACGSFHVNMFAQLTVLTRCVSNIRLKSRPKRRDVNGGGKNIA